jgi:L-ascorbate metabolism protein UlaG (beta-lactamase superfamily)
LVIDPGVLSDPSVLEAADAVLITHEHTDHFAAQAVAAGLAANSDLQVWGPASVVAQVVEIGAPTERVHEAADGAQFSAAGFSIQALGREHAVIHPALPPAANVAYLIEETALHPRDLFTTAPEGIALQALFLPISAPWLKLAEAADYLHRVEPAHALPIHDAFLSDPGRGLTDQIMTALAQGINYRRLAKDESLTLPG